MVYGRMTLVHRGGDIAALSFSCERRQQTDARQRASFGSQLTCAINDIHLTRTCSTCPLGLPNVVHATWRRRLRRLYRSLVGLRHAHTHARTHTSL